MITSYVNNEQNYGMSEDRGIAIIDYVGLSTDEKPSGCHNGTIFLEMDTCKVLIYDYSGDRWLEW